jgi:hypothetical protein
MKLSRFPLVDARRVLGLALLLLLGLVPASAAPLKRVKVQFAPHLSSPLGAQIRSIFPAQLQAELDARPIDGFPDGASVTIRVEAIQLSSDVVGGGFFDDNLPSFDTVEGVALVQDAKGNLIKRVPLIANSRPLYNMMDVNNEPKRVIALMEILAYWIPRQVHP